MKPSFSQGEREEVGWVGKEHIFLEEREVTCCRSQFWTWLSASAPSARPWAKFPRGAVTASPSGHTSWTAPGGSAPFCWPRSKNGKHSQPPAPKVPGLHLANRAKAKHARSGAMARVPLLAPTQLWRDWVVVWVTDTFPPPGPQGFLKSKSNNPNHFLV